MTKSQQLEHRLNCFAVEILHLSDSISRIPALRALANQISRSGTSPALNYGEAQGAQSRKDFVHKIHLALKELRETRNCLKIISMTKFVNRNDFENVLKECNELTAIFHSIQRTAKSNMDKSQLNP